MHAFIITGVETCVEFFSQDLEIVNRVFLGPTVWSTTAGESHDNIIVDVLQDDVALLSAVL